ncbi:MAG: type II secretion system protein [Victivallales bacterium]|nr:type II secretion system protein [Victivallales bacterium]
MLRKRHFTLMETMVAAVILALAVVSTMGVLGNARSTLLRAEQRWAREHLLAQVAELYLLGGINVEFPEDLLPEGFYATCELYQAEDVHDDAMDTINGWMLCEYHIQLFDSAKVKIAETTIQKVLKEGDVE